MKSIEEHNQQRVALYLRVSTDDQVEKYGIDLQKTSLEGLLKSKGKLFDGRDKMILSEKHIYIDQGVSGTTDVDSRPAFSKLKEDILMAPEGQKPFDIVAVYKIDRFARRLKILLDVIDFFEEHDIQFMSANESIDTSTPFGKAMLGIVGVIAELEIETTKERTQAGREEAVKTGVIMGANAFYGYEKNVDKTLIILPEEAEIVKKIFTEFVDQRKSAQQIADSLTSDEILSPEASAVKHSKRKGEIKKKNSLYFWRAEKVRDILSNEVYIGNYYFNKTHKGKTVPRADWELSQHHHSSIIDAYKFKQAEVLLKQSKQLANSIYKPAADHLYLLSSLLKCDYCKRDDNNLSTWVGDRKKLTRKGTQDHYSYAYKCGRKNTKKNEVICRVIPIPAAPLEEYLIEMVRKLLSNPLAVYNYQSNLKSSQQEIKQLQKKREGIKQLINGIPFKIERLREQHEAGIIDLHSLRSRVSEVTVKEHDFKVTLEEIEYRIGQTSLSAGYVNTLELFSQKYIKVLNNVFQNRKEIFDIFHILINEITVFSRLVTKKDKIAGRKKIDQLIPYRLEIELRLPQEILNIFGKGFGVKSSDL